MSVASHILVPVDLSDRCAEVVRWAHTHVAEGGKVTLIHVLPALSPVDPSVIWGRGGDDVNRSAHATEAVRSWAAEQSLPADAIEIRVGQPGHAVADAAEALDADLIALPARQEHTGNIFRIGSVAERVVRLARCSVMVRRD